jgi:hypothetical protein
MIQQSSIPNILALTELVTKNNVINNKNNNNNNNNRNNNNNHDNNNSGKHGTKKCDLHGPSGHDTADCYTLNSSMFRAYMANGEARRVNTTTTENGYMFTL